MSFYGNPPGSQIFVPSIDANSIGVGNDTLNDDTSGQNNVALGGSGLGELTTGSNNVSVGYNAGSALTTGSSNVLIGKDVASTTLLTGSNNIIIGTTSAADTAGASTSNSLWLGGGSTAIMSATSINSTPAVTIPGTLTVTGALTQTGNLTLTGLLVESTAAALTAAGSNQAGALALTKEVNQISTAAAGTGVSLPLGIAGLTVYVINNGANSIQVYGGGTDTIDGVVTTTGVTQMTGSMTLYTCTTTAPAAAWVSEGLATGYSGSLQTFSYADAQTASAGQVQGGSPITTMVSRYTTVASSGNSATLPTAAPGLNITIINAHASNSIAVFPASGDAINALSANSSFSLPAVSVCEFFSTVAGKWNTVLSPSLSTGTGSSVLATSPTITSAVLTTPQISGPTPVAVGSSLTINATTHLGAAILLNTVGGSTATLPAATGTGNTYKFVVSATTTSAAHKILAASSADFINGIVTGENANTAKCFASAAATNHSIQMPFAGSQPSGGFIGDWFEFVDIATNLWTVRGMYQAGTTPTTPFSSATS